MKRRPFKLDPDEAAQLVREAFYTQAEPCENCGRPCVEGREHVPGFDFAGCRQCAAEARAVQFARENCPSLSNALTRCSSVIEVREAMRQHGRTCEKCKRVAQFPNQRKEAA